MKSDQMLQYYGISSLCVSEFNVDPPFLRMHFQNYNMFHSTFSSTFTPGCYVGGGSDGE